MKVKELIELLQNCNPEDTVIVDGYETGYDEVKKIYNIEVIKHPSKEKPWYDGELQDTDVKPISWLQDVIQAVYLPRAS